MNGTILYNWKGGFPFLSVRCDDLEPEEYDDNELCPAWNKNSEKISVAHEIPYEDYWKSQKPVPGMIKSVYVENFLGHRELKVNLCRNVNVISEPGSISTIFTAIQVGLGATAAETGVAKHLQDLIRLSDEQEEDSIGIVARICIVIMNAGENGFQRESYGDEIHVERYISSRGGCFGFKILDAHGVEKSRDKKDLEEMLEFLNLVVDNPAAILKQSRAKRLGKPKELYRFFARATKLDEIYQTYRLIEEEIAKYEKLREGVLEDLEEKQETLDFVKKKWEKEKQKMLNLNDTNEIGRHNQAVNVKEAFKEATQMLETATNNLEKIEELDFSLDDTYQGYFQARIELESSRDMADIINEQINSLNEDLKGRKQKLKKEQKYLATMASVCFDECVQCNHSNGILEVDFDKGKLKLSVQKVHDRNVKVLPDPEGSFTSQKDEEFASLAFLFSISEPLGYPFQCTLLHPKYCLELLPDLLVCSSKFPNRQFVFLVDDDISEVEQHSKLKIIKL